MNEVFFRNWMKKNNVPSKLQSDFISRLKRIEKEFSWCDIDEQYNIDKCNYLMSMFLKNGKNSNMQKHSNINLPIGKGYMGTYKYALKKYITFLESQKNDEL